MTNIIICADSLKWLSKIKKIQGSVILSPPDISELGMNHLDEYYKFIKTVIKLVTSKLKKNQFMIYIATDRFYEIDNTIISVNKENTILNEIAKCTEMNYLLKKIIINNNSTYKKGEQLIPTRYYQYTNVLFFRKTSNEIKIPKNLELDIIYPNSKRLWVKGFYIDITEKLVFLLKYNGVTHISDFFSGMGTTLHACKKYNIDSLGIELNKKLCESSKKLLGI